MKTRRYAIYKINRVNDDSEWSYESFDLNDPSSDKHGSNPESFESLKGLAACIFDEHLRRAGDISNIDNKSKFRRTTFTFNFEPPYEYSVTGYGDAFKTSRLKKTEQEAFMSHFLRLPFDNLEKFIFEKAAEE